MVALHQKEITPTILKDPVDDLLDITEKKEKHNTSTVSFFAYCRLGYIPYRKIVFTVYLITAVILPIIAVG